MSEWNQLTGSAEMVAAVFVGIVSVARTARLLVFDDFPPVAWLRARFLALFSEENSWSKIAECPFCLTPYLAAGMLGWAWLSDTNVWWWIPNGIWAASYAAAILVAYDQPPDD